MVPWLVGHGIVRWLKKADNERVAGIPNEGHGHAHAYHEGRQEFTFGNMGFFHLGGFQVVLYSICGLIYKCMIKAILCQGVGYIK